MKDNSHMPYFCPSYGTIVEAGGKVENLRGVRGHEISKAKRSPTITKHTKGRQRGRRGEKRDTTMSW